MHSSANSHPFYLLLTEFKWHSLNSPRPWTSQENLSTGPDEKKTGKRDTL